MVLLVGRFIGWPVNILKFIRILVIFVYKVWETECVTAEHVDEREDYDV